MSSVCIQFHRLYGFVAHFALWTQLTELQDEMRRKESRWTSNVTRLKGRISELETENVELRDEIKILEQKRLEWMQVQSSSKQQVKYFIA